MDPLRRTRGRKIRRICSNRPDPLIRWKQIRPTSEAHLHPHRGAMFRQLHPFIRYPATKWSWLLLPSPEDRSPWPWTRGTPSRTWKKSWPRNWKFWRNEFACYTEKGKNEVLKCFYSKLPFNYSDKFSEYWTWIFHFEVQTEQDTRSVRKLLIVLAF